MHCLYRLLQDKRTRFIVRMVTLFYDQLSVDSEHVL